MTTEARLSNYTVASASKFDRTVLRHPIAVGGGLVVWHLFRRYSKSRLQLLYARLDLDTAVRKQVRRG